MIDSSFLHTYGCRHLNLIKYTLKYIAFTSDILILTSCCYVLVTFRLKRKSYVMSITTNALKNLLVTFLSGPRVYQFYLIQVNKIIRILHECEVLIEKSVPRDTVWHHEAPLSDAKLDPRDRFADQYLKLMIDSFSCTPMGADA